MYACVYKREIFENVTPLCQVTQPVLVNAECKKSLFKKNDYLVNLNWRNKAYKMIQCILINNLL